MNRMIVAGLLMVLVVSAASSQQVIVTGQWSMQADQECVVSAARDGEADHMGGIGTELVFHNLGFGFTGMVSFDETLQDIWVVGWDIRTYMSYHFFGSRSFLDPFFQAGFGAGGDVEIDGTDCGACESAYVRNLALGLYPYIGGGVGLNFRGGMYMSGQFNWRPTVLDVPCATVDPAEMEEFEVVFALGFAFGGRY